VYVVQPGDTVWSIARRSSGPTADPRPLVDALVQANGLEQSVVVPGERLVIPAVGWQASGG
jgi:LysM repeat protein